MNEVYNGGFSPEFSVSMFKEIFPLVLDYVQEIKKWKNMWKSKTSGKICVCMYYICVCM